MFLVKQLDYLQPYLEELIPTNKKAFLSQFYSQVRTFFGSYGEKEKQAADFFVLFRS